MTNNPNDILHGIKLETIVTELVDDFGWDKLGSILSMRCFIYDPSIKSCLKFLRKELWARQKVEKLYIRSYKN
jgi:uncharacterized protein (DUF2132 family)